MNTALLERAPVEDEKAEETEAAPMPHEAEPVEDIQDKDAGFATIPEKEGLTPAERNRIRKSPRTKKILYNSVMLLVTFGNQIAAQVDPIEKANPPAIAQMQQAVDQEKLSDDEESVASNEETPLTPEEIAAKEVAEYPFVKVAPQPADSYDAIKNENENIILELKRGQNAGEEDEQDKVV